MALPFSTLGAVLETIEDEIGAGLQIHAATQIAAQRYPQLNPGQPLLLSGLSDATLAQRVRELLLLVYPGSHPVRILRPGESKTGELEQLGEYSAVEPEDWLFIPPLSEPGDYTALQDVVAHLRAPDGCPWDRELTWGKLRASLLEETYELLDALDAHNPEKVAEEQGDLLLQIAMQAQIALEEELFRPTDVIRNVVSKLIRRHPHVFGDVQVNGTQEVLANWEAIKRAERARKDEKRSPLAGVPRSLPALAQAEAYLDRMSRLQEVQIPDAPWAPLSSSSDTSIDAESFGEALFGLVAWGRARGIEAESALRAANARYADEVEKASEGDG